MAQEPELRERPYCDHCETKDFLVFERVEMTVTIAGVHTPVWEVDCWCGQCETYYGFRTRFPPEDPYVVLARNTRVQNATEPDSPESGA